MEFTKNVVNVSVQEVKNKFIRNIYMLWYEHVFIYMTYIVYILYIVMFFHISDKAPQYLQTLNYFRQLFVGLMLIFIFNPLRKKIKFTDFHQKLIFSSAIFLLIPSFPRIKKIPSQIFHALSGKSNTI